MMRKVDPYDTERTKRLDYCIIKEPYTISSLAVALVNHLKETTLE